MESEASAGTNHVTTSATTTSSHELDLFSITVTSNPRRACAARVTVLVSCVCVSVCMSVRTC